MLKGFRDFILRGNVIDLAVAVIMGVAFGAVVNSVVRNLVTPLIALAGGVPDFSALRTGPILWGNILNDVLTFLITAAVVYFVLVLPVNRLLARLRPAEPPPQTTRSMPGVPERHPRCRAAVCLLYGAGPRRRQLGTRRQWPRAQSAWDTGLGGVGVVRAIPSRAWCHPCTDRSQFVR